MINRNEQINSEVALAERTNDSVEQKISPFIEKGDDRFVVVKELSGNLIKDIGGQII